MMHEPAKRAKEDVKWKRKGKYGLRRCRPLRGIMQYETELA